MWYLILELDLIFVRLAKYQFINKAHCEIDNFQFLNISLSIVNTSVPKTKQKNYIFQLLLLPSQLFPRHQRNTSTLIKSFELFIHHYNNHHQYLYYHNNCFRNNLINFTFIQPYTNIKTSSKHLNNIEPILILVLSIPPKASYLLSSSYYSLS
ncbi:hypothetical protein PPL_10260 [Heterostelium album PN500]|uniref:Uncharacterized protein n=1 Tax=Heterostelium pallidum (strain ATCC 26659 / Pp 5 / PN500) TaxID=670386 RepID=D3BQS2_HETP5|nr:hypothetical protein PPL_10260 [Heterostelium album PN500]EFA76492.1 hypothetical protein PPL_10260 [Heterostelium album PN500]|eukprot:XP_020428624.1 hypothetical protein PPL_10260 [Heterostelium album PN500]